MNILFFLKPKSELAFIYDYHTLRQALEIMEHYRYTCVPILNKEGKYVGSMEQNFVPVVDDQEHFIGMITRRDIIKYCYDKIKEYEKNGN